jgi:hypothetical protein
MESKSRVAMLIPDKEDLKSKLVRKNTEGHYIVIKGKARQEDIMTINIHAPNIGAPVS